jgi:hypothetical protein
MNCCSIFSPEIEFKTIQKRDQSTDEERAKKIEALEESKIADFVASVLFPFFKVGIDFLISVKRHSD